MNSAAAAATASMAAVDDGWWCEPTTADGPTTLEWCAAATMDAGGWWRETGGRWTLVRGGAVSLWGVSSERVSRGGVKPPTARRGEGNAGSCRDEDDEEMAREVDGAE